MLFIINQSLQTGVFPSSFKKAVITPLLKKPSLDCIFKNYRPISNLSFISKVLEKVVAAQLTSHLTEHHLLETFQSAYRQHHSTETALLRVQNDILCALDSQCTVLLLLIDLSAAFDTVDHQILLQRLETCFGLSGNVLHWFTSYLNCRQQCVSLKNVKSETQGLLWGVPQGSVLGPILFSLYVSPLAAVIRKHLVNYHMYADDVQIYISFKPDTSSPAIEALQNCVSDIRQWMYSNKLKLNDGKTDVILFGRKSQVSLLPLDCVSVGDCNIKFSTSARNLGILMDRELTMRNQVNSVCQSTFYYLKKISRI